MYNHHTGKDVFLGIVILIVTIWPSLLGDTISMWLVIIAAVLLIIHGLACKNCSVTNMPIAKPETKRKRR